VRVSLLWEGFVEMIEIKNTTIYKCEHCKKIYQKKIYADKHYINCRKSPENTSKCSDFCHYLYKEIFHTWDENGNELKINLFKCSKLDKFMKPIWSKQRLFFGQYDDDMPEIILQPKECEHYKSYIDKDIEKW